MATSPAVATFCLGIDQSVYYSVHAAAAPLAADGAQVIHVAHYLALSETCDASPLEAPSSDSRRIDRRQRRLAVRKLSRSPGQTDTIGSGGGLMNAAADELDRRIVDLMSNGRVEVPPYPAVAMRLQALISGGDYSLAELAKLVGSDQALSAAILRIANSARLRGPGPPVTGLARAIGLVGSKELVRLATALGIGRVMSRPGPLGELRWAVWRQATWSAVLCRELAPLWQIDSDQAFVSGLLHDFGKAVTISCLERILKQGPDARVTQATCQRIVERYHVELALVVAEKWKLPPLLAEVMTDHHRPLADGARSIVALVQATDDIIELLESRVAVLLEDLAAVRHLDEVGRRRTAAALPNLPALLEDFEVEDLDLVVGSDWLLDRDPVEDERWAALELAATCRTARAAQSYRAAEIGRRALRLRGAGAVTPETVVTIGLGDEEGPLQLSATVISCRDLADGSHELEVRPFSLDGETRRRWLALWAQADNRAHAQPPCPAPCPAPCPDRRPS